MSSLALTHLSRHPLTRLVLRLPQTVVAWDQRRRTRADLRALDAHLLQDIGLNWADARTEAEKPFWRA